VHNENRPPSRLHSKVLPAILELKLNQAEPLRTTPDGADTMVVSGVDPGGPERPLTTTVPAAEQLFFWRNGCSLPLMSRQTKSA
jgi:hypothetical protein